MEESRQSSLWLTESREGKKMVKLYGIGAVPAMVIVIEGREWIEAFCKGWHGEEEDAQD